MAELKACISSITALLSGVRGSERLFQIYKDKGTLVYETCLQGRVIVSV